MSQTAPQNLPVPPPQPDKDSYGPAELGLFQTFTRDSYRAAFGMEAPSYDSSRLIKTWFDTSVTSMEPDDIVLYRMIAVDAQSQWRYHQLAMPAKEAWTVNLPGLVAYPAYVIAPTSATRGPAGISPDMLSLESDANALFAELGIAATLQDQNAVFAVFQIDYKDDPRRAWQFSYGGGTYNVGQMLKEKNAIGVGAPGHWHIGASDGILWVPDPPAPTGVDDTRPPRPMPVRDLLPNETLSQSMMGPMIVRTDRHPLPSAMAGQFTDDDRAMLREIHDLLAQLASK